MSPLTIIKSPIEAELVEFTRLFDESLSSSNPLLNEVVSYIRKRNGKMMRPVLVFLMAKLYGPVTPVTFHAAVALELLHTASLVHDDVVDESDKRRGQPSVNAIYDNRVAILVGDYMFALCLLQANKTCDHRVIEVISVLGCSLSDGELLQLSNIESPDLSEEIYFDVIRKKTASLFAACGASAALSVSVSDELVEKARLLGEYIGICFQIKDDIFDYSSDSGIGKPTSNDMYEGKLTLPAMHVINRTSVEWVHQIATKVKEGSASVDEIARLVEFVIANGGIEYAEKRMLEFRDKALALFADQSDSEVKASLIAYINYVVERKK